MGIKLVICYTDLNVIAVVCKNAAINSEHCSESDTASAASMLFNNGYAVTIIDASSVMVNILEVTTQPSTAKQSISLLLFLIHF